MSYTLDWITIKGFRSIASIEKLKLGRINVLIGANGAGKSNFIGSFAFLQSIADGRLKLFVRENGGADQILHFGGRHTSRMYFRAFFGSQQDYELSLALTNDDNLSAGQEAVSHSMEELFGRSDGRKQGGGGYSLTDMDQIEARFTKIVRRLLSEWRIYHVHDTSKTSPMRRTAQLHDNAFLRPDGANLPAFLYRLQEKEPESYALIRSTVQSIAPFFDDFDLKPEPLNEETIRLAWRHKDQDRYFGASALSDGSLRFMFLATLLLQPVKLRPSIILVDEPELGLHPKALALLAALVRQASADTQVIMATQSAALLDYFEPKDVLVAESVNGATVINRLDPVRLASWLEDYSLGQLWDKNELGGRP